MRGDPTHPEQGRAENGELFHVLEMPVFRKRYPAPVLQPRARNTERIARGLSERLGMRSVLGLAFYPWHDQTTLWWFEQGMLALLGATGWKTVWVTDARYRFDDDRLAEVGGQLSIIRHDRAAPRWEPPAGHFDTVVTLFPCDHATRTARLLGAQLITFAIKNLHDGEQPLVEVPPDGTPLWHAFAGSTNFLNAAGIKLVARQPRLGRLGRTADAWRLRGAPFPTNRYYFPLRSRTPEFDALLLGSKSRDADTTFAALKRAGAGRIAVVSDTDHVDQMRVLAQRHGVDATVHGPLSHVQMLEVLERSRLVVNPIMPPAESHYSLSVPLALGRPIVASELPSVRPFAGPGVLLAPLGDVAAWADRIGRLLEETAQGVPHRPALKQGAERHDVDLFFASAILATLGGAASP
jgi:hypothetical protein